MKRLLDLLLGLAHQQRVEFGLHILTDSRDAGHEASDGILHVVLLGLEGDKDGVAERPGVGVVLQLADLGIKVVVDYASLIREIEERRDAPRIKS